MAVEGCGTLFVAVHDVFPSESGATAEAESVELAGGDVHTTVWKNELNMLKIGGWDSL